MNRKIDTTVVRVTPLTPGDDPIAWLKAEMVTRKLPSLLAHADDGVIWGRLEGEAVITAQEALQDHARYATVSPPLRAITLQQARAFGPRAELMLWRDSDGALTARLIEDGLDADTADAKTREYLDEPQMLWGTTILLSAGGFTLWEEGAQGMRHAVPYSGGKVPPLLGVRHYLADAHMARIALSRLTGLLPPDGLPVLDADAADESTITHESTDETISSDLNHSETEESRS